MIKESPIIRSILGSETDKNQAIQDKQRRQVEQDIRAGRASTNIYTPPSDDGSSSGGVSDDPATDMGFSTAQGGFIPRRKKRKQMKQGGLASR